MDDARRTDQLQTRGRQLTQRRQYHAAGRLQSRLIITTTGCQTLLAVTINQKKSNVAYVLTGQKARAS
jgi:hypothetical protein